MGRAFGLVGQHHPLGHAEAMLLVNHGQAQILVLHRFLKDRMGADQDVDAAIGQPHQRRLTHLALVAPGQDGDLDRQARRHFAQRLIMLARQYLGRGQHRPLHPGLDRVEQRHQRHQRFARPDIALQQSQHRRGLRHVALNLAKGPPLRTRWREGQLEHCAQPPVTRDRHAAPPSRGLPHQHQRQLSRENLVIGQPLARHGVGRVRMDTGQRLAPARPVLAGQQAGFDPFGQVGRAGERLPHQIAHPVVGQPFGQAIDRLARGNGSRLVGRQHMVGMNDLKIVAIGFQLARYEFGFAQRQQLARPGAVPAEIGERYIIAMPVGRMDAERRAGAAARSIIHRGQDDADHPARIGHIQFVGQDAIDPADRQVERHIDRARQPQPLQRAGQRRSNALKDRDFGKERIENIGSHVYLLPI